MKLVGFYQIDREGAESMFMESSDENRCNWMMFVRPADNYSEQNMVVYQHGGDLFFSTTKNIEAKSELKVCMRISYCLLCEHFLICI